MLHIDIKVIFNKFDPFQAILLVSPHIICLSVSLGLVDDLAV